MRKREGGGGREGVEKKGDRQRERESERVSDLSSDGHCWCTCEKIKISW